MDDNNILTLTGNKTTVTPEIRLLFESHLPLNTYRLLQLVININHSQNIPKIAARKSVKSGLWFILVWSLNSDL